MSSLRQLRSEATKARKAARRACAIAFREARAISTARAAQIKANELRIARAACDSAHSAALALVQAYNRARPPETPARGLRRAKRRERREFTRRDAVARVRQEHDVPERVAELAVKRAERLGGLPRTSDRWRELADRAARHLDRAWIAYERESGPPGFVPRRGTTVDQITGRKKRGASIQPVGRAVPLRKKKRRRPDVPNLSKKSARRRRAAQPIGAELGTGELVIVMDDEDVPF